MVSKNQNVGWKKFLSVRVYFPGRFSTRTYRKTLRSKILKSGVIFSAKTQTVEAIIK